MTNSIEDALLTLSDHDQDHAFLANGVGFNGRDTEFGNSLADQLRAGRTLSFKQRRAAYKMLRTYKGQLLRNGIDYDQIEAPVEVSLENAASAPVSDTPLGQPEQLPSPRKVSWNGQAFVLTFPYDAEVVDGIRALPKPKKFDRTTKAWEVTASNPVALKDFLSRFNFTGNSETHEALKRLIAVAGEAAVAEAEQITRRESMKGELREASSKSDTDFRSTALALEPFPFQHAGIEYALKVKNVIIGDEMGLGKTIQALGVLAESRAFPTLVVCPATLKWNWKREIEKWIPGTNVHIVNGTDIPTDADIYIINYDLLSRDIAAQGKAVRVKDNTRTAALVKIPFRALIVDESHYVKEQKAKRTKALKFIAKLPSIEYRILLSGTPIINRPKELVSQLDIVNGLAAFGGAWKFLQRYCDPQSIHIGGGRYATTFDGAENTVELNQKLRETCYVRRLKADVLTELPDKIRSSIPVDLTNRAEYKKAYADIIEWIRINAENDADFLAEIMEEAADMDFETESEMEQWIDQQARDNGWSKAQAARRAETIVRINKLKSLSGEGKVKAAIEWIENYIEQGEKLVVFAHHRTVQRALLDHFTNAARVIADDNPKKRAENVERFQTDDDCMLIICSLKAAREGITLTAAHATLFLELGWTPGEHDQAEDRVHRIGQTADSVTAYYLLGQDTIDEDIATLIEDKRRITREVADGTIKAERTKGSILSGLVKGLLKDAA